MYIRYEDQRMMSCPAQCIITGDMRFVFVPLLVLLSLITQFRCFPGFSLQCSFLPLKLIRNLWEGTLRLLKPSLNDFEHYLASMWNEHNGTGVWTFFGIALLWLEWKLTFPVLWQQLSFTNWLTYWVQHFNSIMF